MKSHITIFLIASTYPVISAAQSTIDSSLITPLPDVVVTATRVDTPDNQLATGTTVITRQDIDNSQFKTLPDILKTVQGVEISQSGGYGQTTDLFLRGSNPSHVLVLIDGIKVGSITSGTMSYELIPVDQIERIEIIRGPQSSLYGSEAIGGVIQIFTRKADSEQKTRVSLEAGGGTYDTAHVAGSVNGRYGANWFSLGVSNINSQGFNTKQNNNPSDDDSDGYDNTGLNARFGHKFSNHAEVEAFFMRTQGQTHYDSSYGGDHSEFANQVVGINGHIDFLPRWRSLLRLGQSLNQLDTFYDTGVFESRFNTTRWNLSWLNQITLSDKHQLTLGTDYRVDEAESNDLDTFNNSFDTYLASSRYDVGVFTELHSQLWDNHFINASLRWDENQASGDYVTGSIAWRYNSPWGISPFASFGNAFKAPTFNELYWPDTGFGGGNPLLKPEESETVEVGLAGQHRYLQWELRAYHTNVENLISGWPPVNVGKARIEGIEAEFSTEWAGWRPKLTMSLLEPIDTTTGLRLQRRADKSLAFDLSKTLGQVDLGMNVLAKGDRPDIDYNTYPSRRVQLAGYVTVDLRAAWHITKAFSISAKLNNLLDQNYQTAYSYYTPHRNFFIDLHYTGTLF